MIAQPMHGAMPSSQWPIVRYSVRPHHATGEDQHSLIGHSAPHRAAGAAAAKSLHHCSVSKGYATNLHPPESSFLPSAAAAMGAPHEALPHSSAWWWGEDVAGNRKPGWNSNSSTLAAAMSLEESPSIAFNVVVGAVRRVQLRYLSSHDRTMGRVNVTLSSLSPASAHASAASRRALDHWILDSRWVLPYSVTTVDIHELPAQLEPRPYLLEVRLLPTHARKNASAVLASRFKLLGVQTC